MTGTADKYFHVRALIEYDDGKRVKKVTEEYLIQAINVTDAETKLFAHFEAEGVKEEFRITSVRETAILEVIE